MEEIHFCYSRFRKAAVGEEKLFFYTLLGSVAGALEIKLTKVVLTREK